MPYSVLIAQIENPITAPWQRSQLYNFTALCFLCGATWRNRYFTMNYQARLLSYLYSNKTSLSLKCCNILSRLPFFHWCDKQDWATVWYALGSSPKTGNEQILRSLVEEVGSAAGVGPSLLDHIGPHFKVLLTWTFKALFFLHLCVILGYTNGLHLTGLVTQVFMIYL